MSVMQLPLEFVESLFFVKLVVSGHGTIYNTGIDSWFFKGPHPSWILVNATLWSAIAGTLMVCMALT